jgi:hypothetical protein
MRLQTSGYHHSYRLEVLQGALATFKKQEVLEDTGVRPINRPDAWDRKERAISKLLHKKNWFRKGEKRTVLFVPATPGSALARSISQVLQKQSQGQDWGIRVVERGGRTLQSELQTPYPVPDRHYLAQDCMRCDSGSYGQCRKTNVCY